ncbi:MAG: hypothetical protein ABIB04_04440 [Patescibacteria group bacterium]
MKRWSVIFLSILLILGGVWWFWSLGNIKDDKNVKILLKVEQNSVEVKRGGQSGWRPASREEELMPGDTVRTDESGEAILSFFKIGESRLAPNSEITLEQAEASPGDISPFLVKLKISAGSVWSRVLRLLDLDSAYSVRANNVVATVRGTSFDLGTSTSGVVLLVSEASIQVINPGVDESARTVNNPIVVTEGYTASFDAFGGIQKSEAISEKTKQTDWYLKNQNRDTVFIKQAKDDAVKRYMSLGSAKPESLLDGMVRLSERVHLSLASEKAPSLYARYAVRRLFAIKQLIDAGESGRAFQALAGLEEAINAKYNGSEGEQYRKSILRRLRDFSLLLQDVGPEDPNLYRLKQRLEDLSIHLSVSDALETAYARMMIVDSRLDEAAALILQSSLDDAKSILDTARSGISNVERDIDRLPDNTPAQKLDSLRGKLYALKARETAIRIRLATAIMPPESEMPEITDETSATSTITDISTASTTDVASTQETSTIQRIALTAKPSPVTAGESVSLSVRGIREDGSQVDLTAKSTFGILGSLGSLNGPVYFSTQAGSVTLQATFKDQENTFSATMPLQILPKPANLSSIEFLAEGSTSIIPGVQVPLKVTAIYSDGSKKIVTGTALFASSNPDIGIVSGGTFVSQSRASGLVRVTAVYRENGIDASASLDFVVSPK